MTSKHSFNPNPEPYHYLHHAKEKALALELAEALNDTEALSYYLGAVKKYPETLLREILIKVISIPPDKIKKTRGALFNYLLQQYEYNQYNKRSWN